jgi:hypothetical protein
VQFQPLKILGAILFVSMPLFMLLGAINSFATSSGLARAANFFMVLGFGALALMIGLVIWERAGLSFNLGQSAGGSAPAKPAPAPDNPEGGFSA